MRALLGTMRTAILEAWSNRRSFWVQASAMILDDAAWVAFWVLFSTGSARSAAGAVSRSC
jgi:hypothetical protein